MRELGYIEGKNILIEYRYADGKTDRVPALADELVRIKVDIIVTGRCASDPFRQRRNSHDSHCDGRAMLIRLGAVYVASLARPGGNITGFSTLATDISGKRLELLKEIVPRLSHVAVFGTSSYPGNGQALKEMEVAAGAFGMKLQYLDVLGANDIANGFREASKAHADAVLVLAEPRLHFSANADYRPRNKESCSRRFIRMANMWKTAGS